jgi:hypothetical protein
VEAVEGIGDVHHDRSNGVLELGYYFSPSSGAILGRRLLYPWRTVVSPMSDFGPPPTTPRNPIFSTTTEVTLSPSISVVVCPTLTADVEVYCELSANGHGLTAGHKIDHGSPFGFSWGFSPKQVIRRMFAALGPERAPVEP